MMPFPLDGETVVDLSSGIPGAYASKFLADAGADVIKVEGVDGDPLRRWSASGRAIAPGDDGALFQFLAGAKRSVVVEDPVAVRDLVRAADGVVWSPGSPLAEALPPAVLADLAPQATVLSITPFGLDGPWAGRPASEATIQSWAGSPGQRGAITAPPLLAGGRLAEWIGGLVGAVGYLTSRHRRVTTGIGEVVDVSMLAGACLTFVMYPVTHHSIAGTPRLASRYILLPGVHPAKDGYVGFMVVTGQQWLDFCVMVERPDWEADAELGLVTNRIRRRAELLTHIDGWMQERTCEEIAEYATLLRIPVAVLGNGATLPHADHLVEQGFFVTNPRSGFVQPAVPYRFHGARAESRPPLPAPRLGEHTAAVMARPRAPKPEPPVQPAVLPRPFAGLRVADFCANWAGPIIGHVLALFGADVIKVESATRPDALRFNSIKPMTEDAFWEWAPLQHGPNTSKRDLTLDMSWPRGRELAMQLLQHCDVALENFSPRVVEGWGFTWEALHSLNPALIFVRAPAYGLDGPWRDRVGYAQTIEMTSGLAWITGFREVAPDIPNGLCDPNAGLHATAALLLALEHRRRTGEGSLVEVPMIGGALNIAAEQIVEHEAYGHLMERDGNRAPWAAPQGIYRTATEDLPGDQGRWITIAVETDEQWRGLCRALGWTDEHAFATHAARRARHDELDARLALWCSHQDADAAVEVLWAHGVPVAKVVLPHEQALNPQLQATGWFSSLRHPVTGPNLHGGFPAVLSRGPHPAELHRSPPPLLGQHNHEILSGLLGLDDAEIAQLAADGVIGTKVEQGRRW